jgi:hypothetical protein
MAPMRKVNNAVTNRDAAPRPEIITQDEMRDLIQAEVEAAGNIPQMCRNLHMRSSTPVYLALQGERDISDNISLLFGFERTVMFKRIGHATRR